MLVAAVDIKLWLREDRNTPYAERLHRDRKIGHALPAGNDYDRLLGWWSQIHRDPAPEVGPGARVAALRSTARAILLAVGVAFGTGVGGLAFGYQGEYPVNLFTLLGVLVAIPLLLLVVTLILLPGRIPGLAAAGSALSSLNPARWAAALVDRFAAVELFAVFGNRPASAFASPVFARWQLIVFSQWFAVGFFLGVLVIAWLLVAFTDLAFGWSTTLEVEPQQITRLVTALAAPWSAWLAIAVPEVGLVEASRFFRLDQAGMAPARVVQLGQWWPFVLMTIFTYGLLPRLGLLGVGAWRLRVATRSLLREDPEVTALLDRLDTPRTSYEGDLEPRVVDQAEMLPAPTLNSAGGVTAVLVWNEAVPDSCATDWLARNLEIEADRPLRFGVLQDQEEQRRRLAEVPRDVRRLVIFTKGWEPPLLEFADFLSLVRDRLGAEISISLAPVDVTGTAIQEQDREVWATALARFGDARLYVVAADRGQDVAG